MRKLSVLLVFACSSVILAAQGGDRRGRPNFYPIKVGAKWHYRIEVTGQPAVTVVMEAAKVEKFGGVEMFRMELHSQGKMVASEHLSSDDRGVFRHRVNDQATNKPVCLMKYPVTPGETWRDEVEMAGEKTTFSVKVDNEEELQVPAGKFKAVPVHLSAEVGATKISTTYWFAVDVGMIKQSIDQGGLKINMELEKYEPAR